MLLSWGVDAKGRTRIERLKGRGRIIEAEYRSRCLLESERPDRGFAGCTEHGWAFFREFGGGNRDYAGFIVLSAQLSER